MSMTSGPMRALQHRQLDLLPSSVAERDGLRRSILGHVVLSIPLKRAMLALRHAVVNTPHLAAGAPPSNRLASAGLRSAVRRSMPRRSLLAPEHRMHLEEAGRDGRAGQRRAQRLGQLAEAARPRPRPLRGRPPPAPPPSSGSSCASASASRAEASRAAASSSLAALPSSGSGRGRTRGAALSASSTSVRARCLSPAMPAASRR